MTLETIVEIIMSDMFKHSTKLVIRNNNYTLAYNDVRKEYATLEELSNAVIKILIEKRDICRDLLKKQQSDIDKMNVWLGYENRTVIQITEDEFESKELRLGKRYVCGKFGVFDVVENGGCEDCVRASEDCDHVKCTDSSRSDFKDVAFLSVEDK